MERALNVIGDRWSFLLMREAYFGVRRFDGFQEATGASPNILTDRLKKLVAAGVFAKVQYTAHPPRYEYRLTEMGHDLYPAIVALMQWGDRWFAGKKGPPLQLIHRTCGKPTSPRLVCDCCGENIRAREMDWRAG